MSNNNRRHHQFHAAANALGAVIEDPPVGDFPVQSSLSLPPVGGHAKVQSPHFEFKDLISASSSSSEVEGTYGLEGPRTTARSEVNGLNVLDTVKIDQIVGHIQAEHPNVNGENLPKVYVPRVSFGGTKISPVRIGEGFLEVRVDVHFLDEMNGKGYPERAHLRDEKLWQKVGRLFSREVDTLHCTLVQEIKLVEGQLPKGVKIRRNVVEIDGFGKVFFAELRVHCLHYELTMMRFELDSPPTGSGSASANVVNGDSGGG